MRIFHVNMATSEAGGGLHILSWEKSHPSPSSPYILLVPHPPSPSYIPLLHLRTSPFFHTLLPSPPYIPLLPYPPSSPYNPLLTSLSFTSLHPPPSSPYIPIFAHPPSPPYNPFLPSLNHQNSPSSQKFLNGSFLPPKEEQFYYQLIIDSETQPPKMRHFKPQFPDCIKGPRFYRSDICISL